MLALILLLVLVPILVLVLVRIPVVVVALVFMVLPSVPASRAFSDEFRGNVLFSFDFFQYYLGRLVENYRSPPQARSS